jgi:hypothetical protein
MNSFPPAAPLATPATPPEQQLDATSTCPSTEDINAVIGRMHSMAAGIDGLPTCLLRPRLPPAAAEAGDQPAQPQQDTTAAAANATPANANASIAAGLHAVFERVNATTAVPDSWRTAILVPIYKGRGDQADITNYRPLFVVRRPPQRGRYQGI